MGTFCDYRQMRRAFILCAISFLIAIGTTKADHTDDAVVKVAQKWLALLDGRKWDEAADQMTNQPRQPEMTHDFYMNLIRALRGNDKLIERKLQRVTILDDEAGMLVMFDTSYHHLLGKRLGTEVVVVTEEDGVWKPCSYVFGVPKH